MFKGRIRKMERKLQVATVFSGIGAPEMALRRLGINYDIVFACDNGEVVIDYDVEAERKKVCSLNGPAEKKKYVDQLYASHTRKTNFVKISYLANYPMNEDYYFQDIRLLDGRDFRNKVDLLVGGSPCQSFSTVGFQGGLEDTRGTLFYDYAHLIRDVNPKVFMYENVRGLTTHDGGKTWAIMKNVFDELGYEIHETLLNASDYGIPQTRRRVFIVGFRNDLSLKTKFEFPEPVPLKWTMQDFLLSNAKFGNFLSKNGEIAIKPEPGEIDPKYILTPALKKYVMSTGTKTFVTKAEIDKPIARTLLSTMGNRHRAGVDNYVTDLGKDKIRMLTEREALRLMGFPDSYKIVVSRSQAYKQAGNSIVVDVLMHILKQVFQTGTLSPNDGDNFSECKQK